MNDPTPIEPEDIQVGDHIRCDFVDRNGHDARWEYTADVSTPNFTAAGTYYLLYRPGYGRHYLMRRDGGGPDKDTQDEFFNELRRRITTAQSDLYQQVDWACPVKHKPYQHRDGKLPWCRGCGRTWDGIRVGSGGSNA